MFGYFNLFRYLLRSIWTGVLRGEMKGEAGGDWGSDWRGEIGWVVFQHKKLALKGIWTVRSNYHIYSETEDHLS